MQLSLVRPTLPLTSTNIYTLLVAKTIRGGLQAYQTNGTLLNHVVEEGAPHCYVSVDEKRDLVYAANYHKGQVLVYKRQEEVVLYLVMWINIVAKVHTKIKLPPHVHYTDLTPDNYLVTCDLGY